MRLSKLSAAGVIAVALGGCAGMGGSEPSDASFFVTSKGKGDGANYGGLEGADAYCSSMAQSAGLKRTGWKAYLSTTQPGGAAGVNARDRIGSGPWYNTKGVMVARSVEDLHSDSNNVNKETALDERGQPIKGRGDKPNEHDILTGSDPNGMFSTAGGDTTCKNWTSNNEGSAIVGHHDRQGLADTRHMKAWNSSHGSAGCSQPALVKTGGAGLLYCFAPN